MLAFSADWAAADIPESLDPATAEDLIVELRLGDQLLADAFAGVLAQDRIFLPAAELAGHLQITADLDASAERLEGNILGPDERFVVDIPERRVESGDRTRMLDAEDAFMYFGDLHISEDVLAYLWDVGVDLDTSALRLTLTGGDRLPIRLMADREDQRARLAARPEAPEDYELIENPERMLGPVVGDLSLNLSVDDSGELRTSHTLRAVGDIAYGTGDLFLSGDLDDPVRSVRFTYTKVGAQADLFGLTSLRRVEVGDVSTPSIPLAGGGGGGAGVVLGSSPTGRRPGADRVDFDGTATPGHEVELYLNNTLVDFQTVGDDGRYLFDDVLLSPGTNEVRILTFGPDGSIDEQTDNVFAGTGMLAPGAVSWRAGLVTGGADVADHLGLGPQSTGGGSDGGELAGAVEVDYGVTDWLTIAAVAGRLVHSANAPDRLGATGEFVSVGARTNVGPVYFSTEATVSGDGGYALRLEGETEVYGLTFTGGHTWYADFESPGSGYGETARVHETTAGLRVPMNWMPLDFNDLVLSGSRTQRRDGLVALNASANTGLRIGPVSVATGVSHEDRQGRDGRSSRTSGQTTLGARFDRFTLRGRLEYDLAPLELTTGTASARYSYPGWPSIEASVSNGFQDNRFVARLRAGHSWDFDWGRLSASGSVDSEGNLSAGIGLTTAIGPDPRGGVLMRRDSLAGGGIVHARVFEDVSGTGTYDPAQDRLIEKAGLEIDHRGDDRYRTDAAGELVRGGLPAHRRTNVALDVGTLENPFLQPAREGVSFYPRPGAVTRVDLPVTETGEIEGRVYVEDAAGNRSPQSGVRIEIVDAGDAVVASAVSSLEGIYYIPGIPPGQYRLRIAPDNRFANDPVTFAQERITVSTDDPFMGGLDVLIAQGT